MVSRYNFGKLFFLAALFIISITLLFPFGDAKADTIITLDVDNIITFDTSVGSAGDTFRMEASSAIGDASGCNAPPLVHITLILPAGLTASPPAFDFSNCKQTKAVTYTSSTPGTYVVSVTATGGAQGSTFQVGSATTTIIVTQSDTTPPVVTVPTDFSVEATSAAGATVTFTATANDVVSGSLTPTCSPASGSTFQLGPTLVTCSATDAAGNTGSNSFTVTVVDTTAPVITVPTGPLRVGSSNSDSTPIPVTYPVPVTATDAVDPAPVITCVDDGSGATSLGVNGGTFPIGKTTVTCTATASGGTDSDSFVVLYGRTLITAPTPAEIKWDYPFDVSVLTHGFESDDTIEIRRADNSALLGSVTPLSGDPDGKTFVVSGLTLPKADSNTIVGLVAVLVDNPPVASSSTFSISVLKHLASLSLEAIPDTVVDTAYGTRGALKDVDASGA